MKELLALIQLIGLMVLIVLPTLLVWQDQDSKLHREVESRNVAVETVLSK